MSLAGERSLPLAGERCLLLAGERRHRLASERDHRDFNQSKFAPAARFCALMRALLALRAAALGGGPVRHKLFFMHSEQNFSIKNFSNRKKMCKRFQCGKKFYNLESRSHEVASD